MQHFIKSKEIKVNLAIVFIIALSLRLALFLITNMWEPQVYNKIIIQPGNDPLTYHTTALEIMNFFESGKTVEPNPLRTAGYPVFLAMIYSAFGTYPWIVLLVQIIIDSLSAVILLIIFSRYFNLRIALFAGLFYAFDPHLIIFSLSMYSDTLLVFFLILTFYFLSKYFLDQTRSRLNLIIFSALLGISTLIKPISQFVPLIILVFILIKYRASVKQAARHSVYFLTIFFLVLSPQLIHNYICFNRFFLTVAGDYNLLRMSVVPILSEKKDHRGGPIMITLLNEADSLMLEEGTYNDLTKQKYIESDSGMIIKDAQIKASYWRKLAFTYIKNDPVLFVKHYSLGILHTFFNLGTSIYSTYLGVPTKNNAKIDLKKEKSLSNLIMKFFNEKQPFEIVMGIFIFLYLLITYFTLVNGLFQFNGSDKKIFLFLCFSLFMYFILIAGSGGLARFRLPAIPFYLIFSAVGLDHLIKMFKFRYL